MEEIVVNRKNLYFNSKLKILQNSELKKTNYDTCVSSYECNDNVGLSCQSSSCSCLLVNSISRSITRF